MGIYLNPGNVSFWESLHSPVYIDKSELLCLTNERMNTNLKYICVSRPRRFGKTMAADMLTAYYSRGCDSKELFNGLAIASDPSFLEHLNRHNVMMLRSKGHMLILSVHILC